MSLLVAGLLSMIEIPGIPRCMRHDPLAGVYLPRPWDV